ncbi:MAG: anti-sigma factor family protein [bacterium]
MIDKKYIELINYEIDGVLSDAESAVLKEYLANNSEAQELYDDLNKLSKKLQQASEIEPPVNLKKYILNTIPVNKYATKGKSRLLESFAPAWQFRFKFNYVYVFSVGLIVGIIITSLLLNRTYSLDPSNLTGALLINKSLDSFKTGERHDIKLQAVKGSIHFKYAKEIILAELFLKAPQQVNLTLSFNHQDVAFQSFSHSNASGIHLEVSDGELKLSHAGEQRYFFIFKDKTFTETTMNIKIVSESTLLFEQSYVINKQRKSEIK